MGFQPRRGPITQNRQLRPAQAFRASQPQPELAERRVLQSYEREEDTFQAYPDTRMKAPARRPEGPEGPERLERFERPQRPQRPERPERQAILDSAISESVPAPSHQRDIEAAVHAGAAAYNGEHYSQPQKVSFQIHGQGGPHSYRFGYDTGVGYNRQFRYEERDAAGVLHGRYGYYDQEGKLQIVNYTADPQTGFHAEGEHVPKP